MHVDYEVVGVVGDTLYQVGQGAESQPCTFPSLKDSSGDALAVRTRFESVAVLRARAKADCVARS